MLELAEHSITIPLMAVTFLAPIYSLLKEQKVFADFILYVYGKTGVMKSSLVAVFLSHYGNFNRDTFSSSFRDTLNRIEQKAFILKDTVNVIDDFKPEREYNKEIAILEGILAMYGDRVGRGRMNKDGQSGKSAYTARGLAIVTGEVVPDVPQSRLARCVMTNIKEGSIDKIKLRHIQNNTEQLAFAMKLYIHFMICKTNIEKVKLEIKNKYEELISINTNTNLHGRTIEIGNVLKLGFHLYTMFLLSYGIIDETTQKKLEADANITIDDLLESQAQEIEELKPDQMFFNALEQLLSTKQVILQDIDTSFEQSIYEKNEFAGFIDKNENVYYLLPDVIFNKINSFYCQGNIKFPINAKTLWKYLAENGYLEMYKSKDGKKRYKTPKAPLGVKNQYVKIRIPETGEDTEELLTNYAPPRDKVPRNLGKDSIFSSNTSSNYYYNLKPNEESEKRSKDIF